jgi:hypothetical protein
VGMLPKTEAVSPVKPWVIFNFSMGLNQVWWRGGL